MQPIYAAQLLINKIKKDYSDDIAVVVIMGSALYGDTHNRSDLDLFFVPKTERGNRLCFTFIVDGIGFDFWAISWDRLERIANHDERIASIITEGKVIYCSSDADGKRFMAIREKALDTSDHRKFLNKASVKLNEAYQDYYRLQKAKCLGDARMAAVGMVYNITDMLALLNRIPVKRGRGKLKTEIMNMPLVPERFSELYDTAFFSNDTNEIKKAYGELIENTQALLTREHGKDIGPRLFAESLSGLYEEMINAYNKIYHSCEIEDPVTALFASVELTHEIEQAFEGTGVSLGQLPDIAGAYDPKDLSNLYRTARNHQSRFESLLEANGVTIRKFQSFDELEAFLATL